MGLKLLTSEAAHRLQNKPYGAAQGSTPYNEHDPGPVQTPEGMGFPWDKQRWEQGLGMLLGQAQGKDLVAPMQMQRGLEQAQQQVMSAAGQGGYNPANFRNAVMAGSQMQQDIAGQSAIAAAQERNAARQAYINALLGYGGLGASMARAQMGADTAGRQMAYGWQQGQAQRAADQNLANQRYAWENSWRQNSANAAQRGYQKAAQNLPGSGQSGGGGSAGWSPF